MKANLNMRLAALATLSAIAVALPAMAAERIASHDIWIQAEPDRSLTVTEVIEVEADNRRMGDGVVRYVDLDSALGGKARLNLLSATQNDQLTRVTLSEDGRAARIEVGRPAELSTREGISTYKLRYTISEQVNTSGTSDRISLGSVLGIWPVSVEHVRIRIITPEGSTQTSWSAAINGKAVAEKDVMLEKMTGNRAVLTLNRPLERGAALSLVATWPEGTVLAPNLKDLAAGWYFTNPAGATMALAYLALTLFMLLGAVVMEKRAKRAGAMGNAVSLHGLSPAALRVFVRRSLDKRGLVSALLSMAAKGHLTIVDDQDGVILRRNSGADYLTNLTPEETALDEGLFHMGSRTEVRLDRYHRGAVESACRDAEWILRDYMGPRFWRNSRGFFVGAVIMAVIGAALTLHMSMPINPAPYRMAAILAAFGMVFVTCGNALAETIHTARMTGLKDALSGTRNSLALVALLAAAGGLVFWLGGLAGTMTTCALLGLFLSALVFHVISHGPTAEGLYLVEEGRAFRSTMTRPWKLAGKTGEDLEKALEAFEKGMGASYALGSELAWRRSFHSVFRAVARDGGLYQPPWYKGLDFDPLAVEHKLYITLKNTKASL
ncbi:MAG: DUF2207 domain-containing protein [Pseudomonadota bacterium]|nr:DUF2207 domain-containing protein [Pseudomonadota bacterium]